MAVAWVLRKSEITSAIVGAGKKDRLVKFVGLAELHYQKMRKSVFKKHSPLTFHNSCTEENIKTAPKDVSADVSSKDAIAKVKRVSRAGGSKEAELKQFKPNQTKAKSISQPIYEVEPTTSFVRNLKGKRPIVGLTAYDTIMASAVSQANVDFILVGDSLGTTVLGFDTTIPVTIDDMIRHTAAVRRANPHCLLVADLPFGEASLSFDRLLDSCRNLMQQGGADAVKIEGGRDLADDIEKLVATGIPVLGHIGLLPQTVKALVVIVNLVKLGKKLKFILMPLP